MAPADGGPGAPSLVIEAPNVTVEIERSILGWIHAVASTSLEITDSIIDATDRTLTAISDLDGESHSGHLCLRESTVIGKVAARTFPLISNSIVDAAVAAADTWTAPLWAEQRQTGCVRFSFIPAGSRAPRRHRCQPDFAVRKAIEAAEIDNPLLDPLAKARIARGVRARIVPGFTDRRYGRPGYLQLLTAAPDEIRTGASTESEMRAVVMGNQIKALNRGHASIDFNDMSGPCVGNVTASTIVNHPDCPVPTPDFNMIA